MPSFHRVPAPIRCYLALAAALMPPLSLPAADEVRVYTRIHDIRRISPEKIDGQKAIIEAVVQVYDYLPVASSPAGARVQGANDPPFRIPRQAIFLHDGEEGIYVNYHG